jgi:hypothetical protein
MHRLWWAVSIRHMGGLCQQMRADPNLLPVLEKLESLRRTPAAPWLLRHWERAFPGLRFSMTAKSAAASPKGD